MHAETAMIIFQHGTRFLFSIVTLVGVIGIMMIYLPFILNRQREAVIKIGAICVTGLLMIISEISVFYQWGVETFLYADQIHDLPAGMNTTVTVDQTLADDNFQCWFSLSSFYFWALASGLFLIVLDYIVIVLFSVFQGAKTLSKGDRIRNILSKINLSIAIILEIVTIITFTQGELAVGFDIFQIQCITSGVFSCTLLLALDRKSLKKIPAIEKLVISLVLYKFMDSLTSLGEIIRTTYNPNVNFISPVPCLLMALPVSNYASYMEIGVYMVIVQVFRAGTIIPLFLYSLGLGKNEHGGKDSTNIANYAIGITVKQSQQEAISTLSTRSQNK